MGAGHHHGQREAAWGESSGGPLARLAGRIREVLGGRSATEASGIGALPARLRRHPLAAPYRDAERTGDHPAAADAAVAAMEQAIAGEEWWAADVWGHRALWHYEQGGMTLEAARQARRIGDVRWAGGDPASARRYYAEAIDEARDIGAEREQGLAAVGLGRALLDLGSVSEARRLASAALTLLERSGASGAELDAARGILGTEVAVGEGQEERS